MINRRKFITGSVLASAGLLLSAKRIKANSKSLAIENVKDKPIVISTWIHGLEANQAAMEMMNNGGDCLDAVEAGVRITEADPDNSSVGIGGMPDRDGHVTLDACIMDKTGNCGSVTFLQHIKHPISVARKVMEDTPHVMLSGEGALQFAMKSGFVKENLLTQKSIKAWEEWKLKSKYDPVINVENHDTIGLIARDNNGDLAGACTTSGAAFKMHGRVGDSPVIGAGLYVDNEVGGACATGMGELVLKTLGTFLVVELMRQGLSPQEACEEAVLRIKNKLPDYKNFQVGYCALNKAGETGAYCIHPGFNYALLQNGENKLIDSDSYLK